jgi:serine/threonine protein phosphatase PrpC
MAVSYAALTDKGGRGNNEDAFVMLEKDGKYLFAVADGLGGYSMGEVASKTAAFVVKQSFESHTAFVLDGRLLTQVFAGAHKTIQDAQKARPIARDMKTTLTMLSIGDGSYRMAHVGDCRCYLFDRTVFGWRMKSRTSDHSVPQMLALAGDIKENDIRHHPDRNRLTKVLGAPGPAPEPDISQAEALPKEASFLICSDGFWELVTEKDMIKALAKAKSPQEWLDMMADMVRRAGAATGKEMDNYTAVAVWVR